MKIDNSDTVTPIFYSLMIMCTYKGKGKAAPLCTMKVLDGGEQTAKQPSHFTSSTDSIKGWMGSRDDVTAMKKRKLTMMEPQILKFLLCD
jgi:hypothetical protein